MHLEICELDTAHFLSVPEIKIKIKPKLKLDISTDILTDILTTCYYMQRKLLGIEQVMLLINMQKLIINS